MNAARCEWRRHLSAAVPTPGEEDAQAEIRYMFVLDVQAENATGRDGTEQNGNGTQGTQGTQGRQGTPGAQVTQVTQVRQVTGDRT